jgi:hypothetical protein
MTDQTKQLIQVAPWPTELEELVKTFRYKPGWHFALVSDLDRDFDPEDHDREKAIGHGTTLVITSLTYNSYGKYDADGNRVDYEPSDPPDYRVNHYKIVPAATFNRNAWKRWILDQCLEVEQHESCEFARWITQGEFLQRDGTTTFELVDRPFAPLHGPGENPYTIHEYSTDDQRRTSFRGVLGE